MAERRVKPHSATFKLDKAHWLMIMTSPDSTQPACYLATVDQEGKARVRTVGLASLTWRECRWLPSIPLLPQALTHLRPHQSLNTAFGPSLSEQTTEVPRLTKCALTLPLSLSHVRHFSVNTDVQLTGCSQGSQMTASSAVTSIFQFYPDTRRQESNTASPGKHSSLTETAPTRSGCKCPLIPYITY